MEGGETVVEEAMEGREEDEKVQATLTGQGNETPQKMGWQKVDGSVEVFK